MTRHVLAGALLSALTAGACSDSSPTMIANDVGGTIDLTVQTERSAYRARDVLIVLTTNRGTQMLHDDHCGGVVEGFDFVKDWNGSYGMSRECNKMNPQDYSSMVHRIPPGTTHVDTLHISDASYTGTWRARLAILDGSRRLLPESLRVTNVFQVTGWPLQTIGR